jgi:D-serine dehydratase|tara:strand:+ start:231 stop:512 length:282 start_codon:yes stop_codon:yes gene_type:complete
MKKRLLNKVPMYVVLGLTISACAAAWGGSYKVKTATDSLFVVEFDTGLNSSSMMAGLAQKHCEKFGKNAKIVTVGRGGLGLGMGIIKETYECT